MNSGSFDIHASDLPKWGGCEKSKTDKYFNPRPSKEYKTHIGTWVGSAVHAKVAEAELPLKPNEIVFDSLTPTWNVALYQVEAMAEDVLKCMHDTLGEDVVIENELYLGRTREESWPLEMWLTGTCDLKFKIFSNAENGIIDIKTSSHFDPAWIQLGAYKKIYDEGLEHSGEISHLGVIHCPRVDTVQLAVQKSSILWSLLPFDCSLEADRTLSRIAELLTQRSQPTASPGTPCKWCDHSHCAVRKHSRFL